MTAADAEPPVVDPLATAPTSTTGRGWTTNLDRPQRALVIGAHPDDAEFHAGATLAKWATAGTEIFHLVCTDGSKGTWDPDVDQAQLVVTRQAEQRDASRALGGAGEVVFLGWPDGELDSGLRQRSQVAYWIRKLRPDVVLGHDPWKRYRLHPDHRHAGFLAVDGVVAARDPFFFTEHDIAHHRPSELLLFEADEPDHAELVGDVIDLKIAALEAHVSQFETTMRIADTDDTGARAEFHERVVEGLRRNGELAGVGPAEVFKRIDRL